MESINTMKEAYKIWILSIAALVNIVCGAGPSSTPESGPRLSDEELLASLDPNFQELSRVIALRDRGDTSAALSARAAFVRT